ncbi:MAG: hypothetical protein HKN48_10305 [Flavobacteriaceae bacterium]|nr:hypothetical protein [Flavobacteriaceae bacterium]
MFIRQHSLVLFFILSLTLSFSQLYHLKAQNTNNSGGTPVPGDWYGWSDMTLTHENGIYKGTYEDTYEDPVGYYELFRSDGKWYGNWEERSINRKGILFDIEVAANGRRITGKYSVVQVGDTGDMKEDVPFNWRHTIAEEDKPCEFPDLSGIWVCKDKGYLRLTQTNEEFGDDCVSFLEGEFVRNSCVNDLWSLSQDARSYVRGKIVNGEYTLEIFSSKSNNDIGISRTRTLLKGTISKDDAAINPSMQYGLSLVDPEKPIILDPHSEEETTNVIWQAPPPIAVTKNKCSFKKMEVSPLQGTFNTSCQKCKKKKLESGLTFGSNLFTMTHQKSLIENQEASTLSYAVSSGVAREGGPKSPLVYTGDIINDRANSVPMYNINITKVTRTGSKYISIDYEICNWETGEKYTFYYTYIAEDLTEEQLLLPDEDSVIQLAMREAGKKLYHERFKKLATGK